jgi:putative alpha-1,2-mannosidase
MVTTLIPRGSHHSIDALCLDAAPGYFSLTLDNNIKMEATPTRRAGLERFTFPPQLRSYFVLDLSNDLPGAFAGGELNIDPERGRITIGGRYGSR